MNDRTAAFGYRAGHLDVVGVIHARAHGEFIETQDQENRADEHHGRQKDLFTKLIAGHETVFPAPPAPVKRMGGPAHSRGFSGDRQGCTAGSGGPGCILASARLKLAGEGAAFPLFS